MSTTTTATAVPRPPPVDAFRDRKSHHASLNSIQVNFQRCYRLLFLGFFPRLCSGFYAGCLLLSGASLGLRLAGLIRREFVVARRFRRLFFLRFAVRTRLGDITRLGADALLGAGLVTASALLDLLTRDELAGLVRACVRVGAPVLLTLSVTGFVEIEPANVILTAIKKAEEDEGLIFRFYEFEGKPAQVRLRMPEVALRAAETNLLEKKIQSLPLEGNGKEITLSIQPYEIRTVKVWFKALIST